MTKHTTMKELTHSHTAVRLGIDNTPSEAVAQVLKVTLEKIFEPLRAHFGCPIAITSAYRSEALNKALGGSKNSQHCKGEAIDVDADVFGGAVSNAGIFTFIRNNLDFDQLIWEFGDEQCPDWVHVSYATDKNRKEVLRAVKDGEGKTIYRKWEA